MLKFSYVPQREHVNGTVTAEYPDVENGTSIKK